MNTQRVFNGYCPRVLANTAVQSLESSNLESPMLLCWPTRTIHVYFGVVVPCDPAPVSLPQK